MRKITLVRPAATAYFASSTVLLRSSSSSSNNSGYWTRRAALALFPTSSFVAVASATSSSSSSSFSFHEKAAAAAQCMCMSSSSSSSSSNANPSVDMITGYLNAVDAAALDEELMSVPGFTLEQLMELAGLSVAEAVYQVLHDADKAVPSPSLQQHDKNSSSNSSTPSSSSSRRRRILIVCGPGNNGGDGLVAARHLVMFGYDDCVTVVYPTKQSSCRKQPHYTNLVKQCEDLGIPVVEEMPHDWTTNTDDYAAVVDAIFGFSFRGEPRAPFDTIIEQLKSLSANDGNNKVITISVDVPSGWNVDGDDIVTNETKFVPDVLVSLTSPKLCAQQFTTGRHFVGGRFLPPALAEKYNVRMPPYPGVSQVMEVATTSANNTVISQVVGTESSGGDGWETAYAEYLAEKEAAELQVQQQSSTPQQKEETWEEQYAAYCVEKEAALDEQERQRRSQVE